MPQRAYPQDQEVTKVQKQNLIPNAYPHHHQFSHNAMQEPPTVFGTHTKLNTSSHVASSEKIAPNMTILRGSYVSIHTRSPTSRDSTFCSHVFLLWPKKAWISGKLAAAKECINSSYRQKIIPTSSTVQRLTYSVKFCFNFLKSSVDRCCHSKSKVPSSVRSTLLTHRVVIVRLKFAISYDHMGVFKVGQDWLPSPWFSTRSAEIKRFFLVILMLSLNNHRKGGWTFCTYQSRKVEPRAKSVMLVN